MLLQKENVILQKPIKYMHDNTIVQCLSEGKTIPMIAREMSIRKRTLEGMVLDIRRKHNCLSSTQLVSIFILKGFIDGPRIPNEEMQIVQCLSEGKPAKTIADHYYSGNTRLVETLIVKIRERYNCSNAVQLVALFTKADFIQGPEILI